MSKNTFNTKPFTGNIQNILNIISQCLENNRLTNNGPQVATLNQNIKDYLDIKNFSLFCNGTIALLTGLKGLKLKGEVITTPYTFPATVHAIQWAGLTPVFCDIDEDSMCIDPNKIEPLITDKTSAILGLHAYGMPCNIGKIERLANKHQLKIIYDAAHAFITRIDGKSIAEFGDISMFSFHATKLFNTIEGGGLAYNDPNLTDTFNLMKNFGIRNQEEVVLSGINGKMNEIQAIVGIENLQSLGQEISRREKLFTFYTNQLAGIQGLKLLEFPKNTTNSLQYYPIRIDQQLTSFTRDEVYAALAEQNIFARKYFYPLCSNYPCYSHLPSAHKTLLPVANKISNEILCLPFYGELEDSRAQQICNIVKASFN